jgi:exosortase A
VSGTLAAAPAGSPARSLRPALLSLAIAVLVFAVLFHTEVEAAVSVWIASTAFGHCFLVLPIALYLAWERREAFTRLLAAGATPQPQRRPLLGLIPLAVAWLIAELLGIMEGRQLMALSMLEVLAYALLGPVLWRCMAVPLLYLFFLVPFGAFLTPALQSFTVHFIDAGLGLLGIPHVVSNTVIEIPAGSFLVAEACAGLRFLIASIAFGVLYACTIYRSPDRRIAFIAASIVVPILANGLRALGIVVLGEVLGSAQAAAVDHLVYGWLFFTVVTLALILAGLPFREDRLPPPPSRADLAPPRRPPWWRASASCWPRSVPRRRPGSATTPVAPGRMCVWISWCRPAACRTNPAPRSRTLPAATPTWPSARCCSARPAAPKSCLRPAARWPGQAKSSRPVRSPPVQIGPGC